MREMKDVTYTLRIARSLINGAMLCDDISSRVLDKLCDVSEAITDLIKIFMESE